MSSNFVSPFLEEEESCQVSDSIPFIAPSMNDSLVDDFLPETNANISLDDSLCSDELPQPSPELEEQATLSHKPASDYGETVTTDTTGPSSTSLNDSLFDDDETQLHEDCVAARVTKQPSLNDSLTMVTQLPEGDVALPEENAHSFTNEQDTSKDPMPENTTACGKKPENVAINSTPVVGSAIENPSSAIAAPKDYKTIVSVKQNEGKKVRPSFGKKKKSFSPPTTKPASPNTATSETSVKTAPILSTPTKPKPTLQESTNETNADTVQTEAKTDSIPKKTKAKKKEKKVDFSKQISSGKDVKESKENTQTETGSKSTSAKESTPAKPKKKTAAQEERERKHLEREKAKSEKEEAKREKERLKVEKKLEQEKKKAEKGQKKMEKELKKMEKLQTSLAKTKTKLNPPKSSQTDKSEQAPADNCPIDETHDKNDTNAQENSAPMSSTPKEAPPNETGKLDIQELSPIHSTQENSTLMNSILAEAPFNETSNLDNQKLPTNSTKQSLIVCESTTPAKSSSREINKNDMRDNCADAEHNAAKEERLAKPKKRKQQSDTQVSASKKFKPNFGVSKPIPSQGKQDKPAITLLKKSKPKPSKPSKQAKYSSRSKAVNYSGPVWVQCDSCNKWRTLSSIADPSLVPDHWTCSMNKDTEHTTCEAPEEVWSDLGDSQEFVESPFIPGSLVWAKMDGYPWWPAMVEEDPDEETYYEMSKRTNKAAPVRYHVVFLDTPVCRAWVHCQSIRMFTESEDPNQDCKVKVPKKYHRSLKMSTKQASKTLALPFKERLERLSFSQRFRKSGKKRKVASLEEDECLDDKRVKLVTKSGKRKSTHLPVDKVTTPEPLDPPTPVEENTNTSSQSSSIATKQGALSKLENKNNDDASLKYMAEE